MTAPTSAEDSTQTSRSREARAPRLRARWLALVMLAAVLALAMYGGLTAYAQYSTVRALAADGVLHLKRAQALLEPYLLHSALPDAATLDKVAGELADAHGSFVRTRYDLTKGVFSTAGTLSPTRSRVDDAEALATAGVEGSEAGLDLVHIGQALLPILHSGVVGAGATSGTAPPALAAATLRQATQEFDDAQSHLSATIAELRAVEGSPLLAQVATPQQLAQLRTVIAQWPHLQTELQQANAWLQVAPALLGVNGPERFFVELMDRGEMRATGGYIGDYGIATIQNGSLQPFALNDIYVLDRPYDIRAGWPTAPAIYPWWPHPGFALRDSNLSPDFPTAARLAIQLLPKEGGPPVQGVIALTEPTIARVLAVIGPVQVPEYHQVVTAQNLELVIRQQTENQAVLSTTAHEQFTGLLGKAFQAKLHGLSASQLAAVAQSLLTSLRTKDIQIFVADPQTEALVAHLGFDGAMARGPGDVVTVVDENTGVTKANVFTTVTYTDAVTLDAQGTATHHLTISYDFNTAKDPAVRPYMVADYYKTYLRVYTPPPSHLTSLDGFNEGHLEINASDQPGFQMWGGFVFIRDGQPYALHVAWSVPHAATRDTTGHWHYSVDVQHQAGSDQQLRLTVALPGSDRPQLVYGGPLDQDRTFSVVS